MSMRKVEYARWAIDFASNVCNPITWKWNHVKHIFKLVYHSIHPLILVIQVIETCAFSMNTSDHFYSSLSMFLTMSCDKVLHWFLWHLVLGMCALGCILLHMFLWPFLNSFSHYEHSMCMCIKHGCASCYVQKSTAYNIFSSSSLLYQHLESVVFFFLGHENSHFRNTQL